MLTPSTSLLEGVAHHLLDAGPGKDVGLDRHLMAETEVHSPTGSSVLALCVLSYAEHVYVVWPFVPERRPYTREEPYGPQIDVEVEALPDGEKQAPERHMVRD